MAFLYSKQFCCTSISSVNHIVVNKRDQAVSQRDSMSHLPLSFGAHLPCIKITKKRNLQVRFSASKCPKTHLQPWFLPDRTKGAYIIPHGPRPLAELVICLARQSQTTILIVGLQTYKCRLIQ